MPHSKYAALVDDQYVPQTAGWREYEAYWRLSQYHLPRDVFHRLSWADSELLASVRKVHQTQKHICNSRFLKGNEGHGASEPLAGEDSVARAMIYADLMQYANPIPSFVQFWYGVRHHNRHQKNQHHQYWDVVRALQSMKQVNQERLVQIIQIALEEQGLHDKPVRLRDPSLWRAERQDEPLLFIDAFPETRVSGGLMPLTQSDWQDLYDDMWIEYEYEWLTHLMNRHNGEVRFVGDAQWEEVEVETLPSWCGCQCTVYHSRFWHDQTLRTKETRQWSWKTFGAGTGRCHQKERDLTQAEVDRILKEHGNETNLIKYCPASGGSPAKWFIRAGQYITLGELFVFGHARCSCWDLYRLYTSLPIFIKTKYHSSSSYPNAIFRHNAKRKRHVECGTWGLPSPTPDRC